MGKASVNTLLRDEHRQAFHKLIRSPRTTAESAHEWLTKRGYKISRIAIRTYVKSAASDDHHFLGLSPDHQRELIRQAATQLTGPALASLTRYAIHLASQAANSPTTPLPKSK